ncbi:Nitrogenase molybdenum-iron protein, alpha or beta chain [Candidatus Methanophagaceae archaeon]|nr:Nitrogenase molybdenum-iron protein, alpha or beta chain [Methanophagales archaeon]
MLAPLKDAIHVVHGPVGCAYNGVTVRGTAYRIFSTDLREKDIIFGGRERLARTLKEAKTLVPDAKYIFVYTTCQTPHGRINGIVNIPGKIEKALKSHVRTGNLDLWEKAEAYARLVRQELLFDASHKDVRLQAMKHLLQILL